MSNSKPRWRVLLRKDVSHPQTNHTNKCNNVHKAQSGLKRDRGSSSTQPSINPTGNDATVTVEEVRCWNNSVIPGRVASDPPAVVRYVKWVVDQNVLMGSSEKNIMSLPREYFNAVWQTVRDKYSKGELDEVPDTNALPWCKTLTRTEMRRQRKEEDLNEWKEVISTNYTDYNVSSSQSSDLERCMEVKRSSHERMKAKCFRRWNYTTYRKLLIKRKITRDDIPFTMYDPPDPAFDDQFKKEYEAETSIHSKLITGGFMNSFEQQVFLYAQHGYSFIEFFNMLAAKMSGPEDELTLPQYFDEVKHVCKLPEDARVCADGNNRAVLLTGPITDAERNGALERRPQPYLLLSQNGSPGSQSQEESEEFCSGSKVARRSVRRELHTSDARHLIARRQREKDVMGEQAGSSGATPAGATPHLALMGVGTSCNLVLPRVPQFELRSSRRNDTTGWKFPDVDFRMKAHIILVDLDNYTSFFSHLEQPFETDTFVWLFHRGFKSWSPPKNNRVYDKLAKCKDVFNSEPSGLKKNSTDIQIAAVAMILLGDVTLSHIPITIVSADNDYQTIGKCFSSFGRHNLTLFNPHVANMERELHKLIDSKHPFRQQQREQQRHHNGDTAPS